MIIANHNPDLYLAVPGSSIPEKLTQINTLGLFPIVAWEMLDNELDNQAPLQLWPLSFEDVTETYDYWAILHRKTCVWWLHEGCDGEGVVDLIDTFIRCYKEKTNRPAGKPFDYFSNIGKRLL